MGRTKRNQPTREPCTNILFSYDENLAIFPAQSTSKDLHPEDGEQRPPQQPARPVLTPQEVSSQDLEVRYLLHLQSRLDQLVVS